MNAVIGPIRYVRERERVKTMPVTSVTVVTGDDDPRERECPRGLGECRVHCPVKYMISTIRWHIFSFFSHHSFFHTMRIHVLIAFYTRPLFLFRGILDTVKPPKYRNQLSLHLRVQANDESEYEGDRCEPHTDVDNLRKTWMLRYTY